MRKGEGGTGKEEKGEERERRLSSLKNRTATRFQKPWEKWVRSFYSVFQQHFLCPFLGGENKFGRLPSRDSRREREDGITGLLGMYFMRDLTRQLISPLKDTSINLDKSIKRTAEQKNGQIAEITALLLG